MTFQLINVNLVFMKKLILITIISGCLFISGCVTLPRKTNSTPAKFHVHFDHEDYEKAILAAKKFLENNQQNKQAPEALLIIGKSYTRLGALLRRENYLVDRDNYAAFLTMYEKARQAYQSIITVYPNSPLAPLAQLHIGKIYDIDPYGGLNLFDKAIREYRKVIENYPGTNSAAKAQQRIDVIMSQY